MIRCENIHSKVVKKHSIPRRDPIPLASQHVDLGLGFAAMTPSAPTARRSVSSVRAYRVPSSLESQKSSNMARSCGLTAPSSHPSHLISSFRSNPLYFAGRGRSSPRASRLVVAQLFVSAMTRHLPVAERRAQRQPTVTRAKVDHSNGYLGYVV